ncbi:MAG: hypothetical protein GY811_24180 [Myxococcales bacterium]|nr:hypothetical protein [Myxococcales bacterium]
MRGVRIARWLALALLAHLLCLPRAYADTSILSIGPSFPDGPYNTLYVDRSNPRRVAVGTADGRVAWSEDAVGRVSESKVRSGRFLDAMAVRSGGSAASLGARTDDTELQNSARAKSQAQRPVRLFIRTLQTGKGIVRWQLWRGIADPATDIGAILMPSPGGNMFVVSSVGIMVSDGFSGAWTRTLGAPGLMPREKVDLVGLSVIANPSNPKFVLAGTTEGVFLSRDGGMNFVPHTDSQITEEMVFEFLWDTTEPDVVLAVGPDTILQSEDGGESFAVAFISPAEINGVVTSDRGVYVATTEGLLLVGGEGTQTILGGESVLGVVPWADEGTLALTETSLYEIDAYGERTLLMRTTNTDPFIRLDGAPGLAYMLSQSGVFRIGSEAARAPAARAPVLAMSSSRTQQAMLDHLGLGNPDDTRLHNRWFAKLLPRLEFDAIGTHGSNASLLTDYTLPIDFHYARASNSVAVEFAVMAKWDLSTFLFGDDNVSNPDLFIESTLRGNRQRLLMEVRDRYRKTAILAHRLKNPPKDPKEAFMWRTRLEEHVSYLEYVTGKQILKEPLQEPEL